VICDQPTDNGGSDQGMSPPEFLLASLATCSAYYATQYLKTRGLPADDLMVRVSAEKALQPSRLASFQIEVVAPGLDERHQAGILRAAKALFDSQHAPRYAKYRSLGRSCRARACLVARRGPLQSKVVLNLGQSLCLGRMPVQKVTSWNGESKLSSRGD